MAATSQLIPSCKPISVKQLADSGTFVVPDYYAFRDPQAPPDIDPVLEQEIPTIDFSVLARGAPHERSQMVRELGRACEEWGFFMLSNHGVPETMRSMMLESMKEFFELGEEEKAECCSWKDVMDSIRYGTSFNASVEEVKYWRDYLKVTVHPAFQSPTKPASLRDVLQEYTKCTRALGKELLAAVWESLELEDGQMNDALGLSSCHQVFAANLYPPCPQPELAMCLPPHSDHGFLTLLYQNGIDGLEIKHGAKWVRVKPRPDCYLVNTGDHAEIVTNGKYKSVVHRAMPNGRSTRMSIVTVIGPSLDTVVEPARQLVSSERPALYRGIRYWDFIADQQGHRLEEKSVVNSLRIHPPSVSE